MEPLQDTPLAQIEASLRRQLAERGTACVSADVLAEAICARCHEEVRVWAENFARTHATQVKEDHTYRHFLFRRASLLP